MLDAGSLSSPLTSHPLTLIYGHHADNNNKISGWTYDTVVANKDEMNTHTRPHTHTLEKEKKKTKAVSEEQRGKTVTKISK